MVQKISILGCGWLGLPLGEFLTKKGFQVLGSTTRKEKFPLLEKVGIQPFQITLPIENNPLDSIDFFNSDLLILNIPPGRRHPEVIVHHLSQIENVIPLIENGKIQKVIFISSTGVYGNENKVVTEEDPLNPIRNSGKALEQVESILRKQKSFQTTILRMAGLVGGERKAGRFLAGKENVLNGKSLVNMVHRDDCIQIIHQIIRQEKWKETFNVCADRHPTRQAFYTAQAMKEGLQPPTFSKQNDGNYKIVSNQKIKKALNYTFLKPDPMDF